MHVTMKQLLLPVCLLGLAACSDANTNPASGAASETPATSALDAIVIAAGKAQGTYQHNMQEYQQSLDEEGQKNWSTFGYGQWRTKHYPQSAIAYFDDLYAYANAHLNDKSGFEALALALKVSGSGADRAKVRHIHDLLFENFLNTPEYAQVMQSISIEQNIGHNGGGPTVEAWRADQVARFERVTMLLGRIAKNATDPVVQNHARVYLGEYLARSIEYMDTADLEAIAVRRARAKKILEAALTDLKTNPITLLLSHDVRVFRLYNETMRAAQGGEAEQRPDFKAPNLSKMATQALFSLGNLSVGKLLPPTTGQDLQGNPQELAQYKGRVLLIDIWATWCGPCIAKFPYFTELKQKYAGRPFEILGISGDNSPEDVLEFLEDYEVPWDLWFSGQDKGVLRDWKVGAFPTLFLADHTGRMVAINPPDNQLEAMLEQLVTRAEAAAASK